MEKWYMTAEDIAVDLGIGTEAAEKIMRELGERIKRKGGIVVPGRMPKSYYLQMKSSDFLSNDGAEDYPMTEKRLLQLKEFCVYSGLGQSAARKFAKAVGVEKRIGHRVLYDRALFDEWCNKNQSAELQAENPTNEPLV